jgi:hypothetical protein
MDRLYRYLRHFGIYDCGAPDMIDGRRKERLLDVARGLSLKRLVPGFGGS